MRYGKATIEVGGKEHRIKFERISYTDGLRQAATQDAASAVLVDAFSRSSSAIQAALDAGKSDGEALAASSDVLTEIGGVAIAQAFDVLIDLVMDYVRDIEGIDWTSEDGEPCVTSWAKMVEGDRRWLLKNAPLDWLVPLGRAVRGKLDAPDPGKPTGQA